MHTLDRIACSLLLTGANLLAQAPRPLDPPIVVPSGCGLQAEDDGSLFGLGADYQVRFLGDRFEWKPILGRAAPHDLPMTMQVTHVGRGELTPVGPATRERRELRVDYVRAQLRERLDLRRDGMKQSFVFDQLPAGRGDLVVRAAITTELQAERAASDGAIAFTFPGAGGLQIGQVLGIDANGHTATGSLRTNGTTLEFVLPAAFVDTAALPLVVDPLIAAEIVVSAGATDDRQVDIAHVGTTYAVVYRRFVSATNTDVYVTYVSDAGVVGSTVGIETFVNVAGDSPRVVASDATANYLAVWNHSGDIQGRLLIPNGAGSVVAVASTPNDESQPTAVGGLLAGNGRVLVAWLDATADAIKGCEVNMNVNPPTTQAIQTFVSDPSSFTALRSPALPRSCPGDRLLLSWVSNSSVLGTDTVRGVFLGSLTTTFGPSFTVAGGGLSDAFGPAVAGNGTSWVIGYRTNSTLTGGGAACVALHQNFTTAVLSSPRALTAINTTTNDIDAAWFRDSAAFALTVVRATANDVLLVAVDPLTCADCQGTIAVNLGGNDTAVAITSTFGQNSSDEGAIAWVPISGTQGNLSMQRYGATGGTVTVVADGPFGEQFVSGCARVGHSNFGVELHGAPAATPTFALFATNRIDAPCGTNTIVPDFLSGFVLSLGNTNAAGHVRMAFNIPNNGGLSGLAFHVQFAKPGSSCFGAFDLSSALTITLQ